MKPYSFREHTADILMAVSAPDVEGLFKNSAAGIASQIFTAEKNLPKYKIVKKDVSLKSPSAEDLFVEWLNEVLYLFFTERVLFKSVKFLSFKDNSLCGVIEGHLIPEEDMIFSREIKAATYHDLKIENVKGKSRAQVILDV